VNTGNKFSVSIKRDSNGNTLSYQDISIEGAAALKIIFHNLVDLAKLVDQNNDVRIAIKEGSLVSELKFPENRSDIARTIDSVVNGQSDNNDIIKCFKGIQDVIKLNGLSYEVSHEADGRNRDLTAIFRGGNFKLRRTKKTIINSEVIFVEGRLYNVGGRKSTNFHIETGFSDIMKIRCSKEQAIHINSSLFEKIYVSVESIFGEEDEQIFYMLDSYNNEEIMGQYKQTYTNFTTLDYADKYAAFYDFVFDRLENNENNKGINEIKHVLRLMNNSGAEAGFLRTALVALKPLKNEPDLTIELKAVAERLKKVLKTKLI
jgi:hypothetical protein